MYAVPVLVVAIPLFQTGRVFSTSYGYDSQIDLRNFEHVAVEIISIETLSVFHVAGSVNRRLEDHLVAVQDGRVFDTVHWRASAAPCIGEADFREKTKVDFVGLVWEAFVSYQRQDVCDDYTRHRFSVLSTLGVPKTSHLFSSTSELVCQIRVAGTGIAPVSGGYEPPEVLLLYPAISHREVMTRTALFNLPSSTSYKVEHIISEILYRWKCARFHGILSLLCRRSSGS